jgi:hypothetical protein
MSTESGDTRTLTGSCMCGEVRYEVRDFPAGKTIDGTICHCKVSPFFNPFDDLVLIIRVIDMPKAEYDAVVQRAGRTQEPACRPGRAKGTSVVHRAFSSLIPSSTDQVWTDTTALSGKHINRAFCGTCGSALYALPESAPEIVFLKAGTLDVIDEVVPKAELVSGCGRLDGVFI